METEGATQQENTSLNFNYKDNFGKDIQFHNQII